MLKKFQFRPGVDRENTRYANEGGWYETDKVRFRRGLPQKIGGWQRLSSATFLGVCRSLMNWVTLGGQNLVSVGTHLKYYIERGGAYYDITPLRATSSAGDVTFSATAGDATVSVLHTAHGAVANDFVTFSGAVSLGGNITADVLNQEYQIATVVSQDEYTIEAVDTNGAEVLASAGDTGSGGVSVVGAYQINVGNEVPVPVVGWGAAGFGLGPYGEGESSTSRLRLWSQANFGEDLLFAVREGEMYYWDASSGVTSRGVKVSSLSGASDVPTAVNLVLVSDVSRFAFAFGANNLGESVRDPMLIRWSDQEDVANWTPAATNQAGSLRLSAGTEIVTAKQARQEVLVWTDSALYGLQYLGAPDVWGAQLLGSNITVAGQNSVAYSGNLAYWMGKDKFYVYDGTVRPLPCSLRAHVFNDFNFQQYEQVTAGTNERFDEVWWFYCSAGETQVDRYIVYNYAENVWYYGTMSRTAWMDADLRDTPLAATYSNNIVQHETGVDCNETGTTNAITATLTSAEFDLDDGDRFMLIGRVLPDVTFDGSTAGSPSIDLTLMPLRNSGAGYTSPASVGGSSSASVTRTSTATIEQFTGQVFLRARGRQMVVKIESTDLGVAWKLGHLRFDLRPSGRNG